MAHVAHEMEREGFKVPLLIGGATTSRVHTAVKIAPNYSGPVVYVPDASRSVGVCTSLISAELRESYFETVRADYDKIRAQHAAKKAVPMVTLGEARANKQLIDWAAYHPTRPKTLGRQVFTDYDLAEIAQYIDWSPFFQTWDLAGSYPKILDDALVGEAARNVFRDAQAMLKRMIDEKWVKANGVIALYAANRIGDDDIELYADESRAQVVEVVHTLRQQAKKASDRYNHALADYVAPKEFGVVDYFGMFAVTAGLGCEEHVKRFEAANDDYNAILVKALADRLAEAFAELMHAKVRRELWAYAPNEGLDNEALIAERYRGIRPAPGYPACPDHTEKGPLFTLLKADEIGMTLTENFAMWPPASVSGYYIAHPESQYFAVGKIDRDQLEEYARRKNMDLKTMERWLSPNLGL